MALVYAQEWEESERGWGVRPDGFQLYPSISALTAGTQTQLRKQRDVCDEIYGKGAVPDEYSRPCGDPFAVEVNQETFEKVHKEGSLWVRSVKELQIPDTRTVNVKASANLLSTPTPVPAQEQPKKKLSQMTKQELAKIIKDATTELSKR